MCNHASISDVPRVVNEQSPISQRTKVKEIRASKKQLHKKQLHKKPSSIGDISRMDEFNNHLTSNFIPNNQIIKMIIYTSRSITCHIQPRPRVLQGCAFRYLARPLINQKSASPSRPRAMRHPPLCVAFISNAPIFPRPSRRPRLSRCRFRATAEEELHIRRAAAERVRRTEVPAATTPVPAAETGPDFVVPDAALRFDEFGVSEDAAAAAGIIIAGRDTVAAADAAVDGAAAETGAAPRVGAIRVGEAARGAREGVLRLVRESAVTGQLRLPTGSEAALLAWEAGLVVAMMLLLRAGVSSTLRWIHARLNGSGRGDAVSYEQSVFECMQRPVESVSVFTVATVLAEAVTRPLAAAGLLRYLRTLRELGFIVCATWFLLRWIDRIRARFVVDRRIDGAQVDATSRIATVATVAVSLLISLDTVGINVQTVLAFGGIGGVAIGFAGREIISNFFGGFMIYVTRPFTVGEWIRSIEEQELNGTVEDIGWYLTRVRTWDKRPLYIPNSRFSTLIVENGSRMANRRILHTLDLRLEDIPVLPQIVADLTKMLMSHSELDPRQHRMAYVDGFGAFSAQVWLSCYTKSVFLYDFRRVQQEVLLDAHEIIRSHGARLATINTRDVRPGIDVDRYGPFGDNASFRSPSNEPKVEETPQPQKFKISDIPGAPFFSNTHASDDAYFNIESGVSEEHFAAVDSAQTTKPAETAVPVAQEQQRSTSEAAVAAAAAALAAARRNAARIEEENAHLKRTNAEGANTMKISAVSGKNSSSTAGSQSTDAADSGTMKISAASKPTAADNSQSTDAADSGTTKISAVSKTSSPPRSSNTNDDSKEHDGATIGTMKITTAPKPTASSQSASSNNDDSSSGTMKISGAPAPTATSHGSDVSAESNGTGAMKISVVPKSSATSPEAGSSGTMKISAVPKPSSTSATSESSATGAKGSSNGVSESS